MMTEKAAALAERIERAIDNKKGFDIKTLDISDMTIISECFIVATGTTNVHVRALADAVMEELEKDGIEPLKQEGYEAGQWIILDYGDVMAHIFRREEREFYNLERLWIRDKNFTFHSDAHETPEEQD